MPFDDNTFNAAMVGFGIRNLTHLKKGFAEMHRVLKPGGKMLCLEFSRPTNPVFRHLYDFYSFTIMPFLGGLITGSASVIMPGLGLLAPGSARADVKTDLDFLNLTNCGLQGGAGMVPFIAFDLSGGANLAGSNVLMGKQVGRHVARQAELGVAGRAEEILLATLLADQHIGAGNVRPAREIESDERHHARAAFQAGTWASRQAAQFDTPI